MEDIDASNIGAVVTSPTALVNIANYFGSKQPQPLPSNISSPKGFVGRELELGSLRERKLEGKTSFVLHGQGGVGKTELALQFMSEIRTEFRAHIRVDMRGLEETPLTPKDAMLEVIRAFQADVAADLSEQDVQNLYIRTLSQYKTLVFLDNAKDRAQVEPLNHSQATIIITSRTKFTVSGGYSKEIEQMSAEDATLLLYSVAGESRFSGHAASLASLAGYLPIALLPLASILSEDITVGASDLLIKYRDRKERLRLTDPNRGNLSVEASFDLSYERLSDKVKRRWRKLAVFPSDFDFEAMLSICNINDEKDGKATLSELVKKHLLMFDADSRRSRLHSLARDYAHERLTKNEHRQIRALHAYHYGRKLSSLEVITLDNLATFDIERANIEMGFSWVQEKIGEGTTNIAEICTLYVGYASDILFLRLSNEEIFEWQKAGLWAYTRLGNTVGQSYCMTNLGRVYAYSGQYNEAISYYGDAIEIARSSGKKKFEAAWLGNLGNVYTRLGEFDKAISCFNKAIAVSISIGNKHSECMNLGNIGNVYAAKHELSKAIEYYEKALSIKDDDVHSRGIMLGNLAIAYYRNGETEKSNELRKEALAILEAVKSSFTENFRRIWAELEGT